MVDDKAYFYWNRKEYHDHRIYIHREAISAGRRNFVPVAQVFEARSRPKYKPKARNKIATRRGKRKVPYNRKRRIPDVFQEQTPYHPAPEEQEAWKGYYKIERLYRDNSTRANTPQLVVPVPSSTIFDTEEPEMQVSVDNIQRALQLHGEQQQQESEELESGGDEANTTVVMPVTKTEIFLDCAPKQEANLPSRNRLPASAVVQRTREKDASDNTVSIGTPATSTPTMSTTTATEVTDNDNNTSIVLMVKLQADERALLAPHDVALRPQDSVVLIQQRDAYETLRKHVAKALEALPRQNRVDSATPRTPTRLSKLLTTGSIAPSRTAQAVAAAESGVAVIPNATSTNTPKVLLKATSSPKCFMGLAPSSIAPTPTIPASYSDSLQEAKLDWHIRAQRVDGSWVRLYHDQDTWDIVQEGLASGESGVVSTIVMRIGITDETESASNASNTFSDTLESSPVPSVGAPTPPGPPNRTLGILEPRLTASAPSLRPHTSPSSKVAKVSKLAEAPVRDKYAMTNKFSQTIGAAIEAAFLRRAAARNPTQSSKAKKKGLSARAATRAGLQLLKRANTSVAKTRRSSLEEFFSQTR